MLLRNKVFGSLAIIVICLTNGWHLAPIQAFAWLSMAIENSDSDNFTEALSSAMEGKETCGICQYVIEQRTNVDDQAIGYWNVVPKWLLTAPSTAEPLIVPPQSWKRAIQQTSVMGDTDISLELPPPKRLVLS
tara:strand:- start:456 stop:854 length:399 start_codon:yes stop_codon:yes gene_type:complete